MQKKHLKLFYNSNVPSEVEVKYIESYKLTISSWWQRLAISQFFKKCWAEELTIKLTRCEGTFKHVSMSAYQQVR